MVDVTYISAKAALTSLFAKDSIRVTARIIFASSVIIVTFCNGKSNILHANPYFLFSIFRRLARNVARGKSNGPPGAVFAAKYKWQGGEIRKLQKLT
jgi:hypothetical protein